MTQKQLHHQRPGGQLRLETWSSQHSLQAAPQGRECPFQVALLVQEVPSAVRRAQTCLGRKGPRQSGQPKGFLKLLSGWNASPPVELPVFFNKLFKMEGFVSEKVATQHNLGSRCECRVSSLWTHSRTLECSSRTYSPHLVQLFALGL